MKFYGLELLYMKNLTAELSPSPVVKWVGGKRQLLKEIGPHLPAGECTYYEPFIGGGAVLFYLKPERAVINDTNSELINLYMVIKEKPEKLIDDLRRHKNDEAYYYRIRALDRRPDIYSRLTDVERASRIIFLNKTCFNGLFRVNKSGQFNSPFGRYKKPNIINEEKILSIHSYFNSSDITIRNTDYEDSLEGVSEGDFVYFDPPYDPVSVSASFTTYTKGGFNRGEQLRLKKVCDRLDSMGVRFLLSNSATDFIRELYSSYPHMLSVFAKRTVNSRADRRGAVSELLIMNF